MTDETDETTDPDDAKCALANALPDLRRVFARAEHQLDTALGEHEDSDG